MTRKSFRSLLAAEGPLILPGAHDALAARLIQRAGFGGFFIGGFGAVGARFGVRSAARLALEVTESPFAAGYGAADTAVCAPITGMLQAVAERVLGAPCEACETECRARGAPRCRFEALLRSKS